MKLPSWEIYLILKDYSITGETLIYDHDRLSKIYDKFTNFISLYQTEISKRYQLSKLPKNGTVLELGCGNGEFAINCALKGLNTIGLDVSKKMINNAKARASKLKIKNIKFINQDIFNFQTKTKFDYLILCYFLNVFPTEQAVEKVITKAKTYLKPTGLILIADELEPHNCVLKVIINLLRFPVFAIFKITTNMEHHKIHDLRKILTKLDIKVVEEKRFLFQYCSILIGKL